MAHWLMKQEPTSYSWADLVRDGRTTWDGVHNATALLHLRRMMPGDDGIFYHSGAQRSGVGILRIASLPRPDPNDPRGSWVVEVEPVRVLRRPIALAEIKADPGFRDLALLRISRLSVMPVSDTAWARFLARELLPEAGEAPAPKAKRKGRGKRRARPRPAPRARRRR